MKILRNIVFITGGIVVFFIGLILYGVFLNLRQLTLKEAMAEKGIDALYNVSLKIDRKNYIIELYSDTILVKNFKTVFGRNSSNNKSSFTDNATPVGNYMICGKQIDTIYHKYLNINFPNKSDAYKFLKIGVITQSEYDNLLGKINKGECPFEQIDYRASIGIHGIGEYNFIFKNLPFVFNWTNGSAAVSDEDIDELYSVIPVGTKVIIVN